MRVAVQGPGDTDPESILRVERITAGVICHGPVAFRVHGLCGKCGGPIRFSRPATLLVPQKLVCPDCGAGNLYRFSPALLSPYSERLAHYRAIEETVLRRMESAPDGPVRQLGRNLLFPVFTYLSNRLR